MNAGFYRPPGIAGLTPGPVPVVVEELVACDAQVQEALADPLEVVQEIAQAGPYPFHRVTVYTHSAPYFLGRA